VGERRYESFGALLKVLPGLSCRVTERLSVGGTFGLGISHAELEGPYFLQGPTLVGLPLMLDLQGSGATTVWSAGLQYRLTEATTIGATYISESDFTLRGNTRVDVPMFGATNYDSQLDVTWPQSVGVGCGTSCAATGRSRPTSSGSTGRRRSTTSNCGCAIPRIPCFPNWSSTSRSLGATRVSVRLGYEQQCSGRRHAAGGLCVPPQPRARRHAHAVHSGTLEHAVSVGYSWCWAGLGVDLGYMVLFGPERTVRRASSWGATSTTAGIRPPSTRHAGPDEAVLSFGARGSKLRAEDGPAGWFRQALLPS
jgi:long-chain fatty acid transport protein